MKKTLLFIITTIVSFLQAADYAKTLHTADKHFNKGNYESAIVEYAVLDSLQPNDPHIEARLGVCHYYKDHNEKALHFLEKAYSAAYRKDDIEYYLARAYMLNLKFDMALKYFELAKKSTKDSEKLLKVPQLMKNCKHGIELIKKPVEAKVVNMGKSINSPKADDAPNIFVDEKTIIFTSTREGSSSGYVDDFGEFLEDIYISQKVDGQWTQPVSIGDHINSKMNDANVNLSFDGGQLFVYKNDTNTGTGDIYVTSFVDNDWAIPVKIDTVINSDYNETSACFSPSEDYIFFTSDRPGGFGGLDIYYTQKDKKTGRWKHAKNMGPLINTELDDDSPFMHADGKSLYFCSEGHNSMGGFDVFMTTFDVATNKSTKPQNLGYPISTPDDDMSFVWSADGTRGYFSTFRDDSYGDRDLYMVTRPNVKVELVVLSGRITTGDKKVVKATDITIIDNATGNVVAHYDSTKFLGDYAVTLTPGKNYGLYVEKKGFLTFSKNINVPANQFSEIKENINLVPVDKGALIVLKNTFFNDSSAEFSSAMIPELDRYAELIKKNPNMIVEIASHAFDYGDNHEKNYELSQKRADAVVKYLLEKSKVNPEHLKGVGYGDLLGAQNNTSRTEFIILQKLKKDEKAESSKGHYVDNGVLNKDISEKVKEEVLASAKEPKKKGKDKYLAEKEKDFYLADNNSVQRSQNYVKPEEVSIKGNVGVKGKSTIKILDGDGHKIKEFTTDENGNYEAKFMRVKGIDYIVVADNKNQHDSQIIYATESGLITKDLKPVAYTKNDKFIIRNLHYASNQDVIDPQSFVELNKLVLFLQTYPNMKVEIGGHTDGIGNYAYNKVLSDKRANLVKKYLVLKNIAASRVITVGYGKSKPLASNDDENEGREINRRTEIKILEF